jgi:phosphoribosylglycinamide formyltransferase-1
MKRIVVLISGRGSNLRAIVDACARGELPARVAGVVSDRADAGGLRFAHEHGIPTAVVARGAHPTREAFSAALTEATEGFAPDAVVLAGFMQIVGEPFLGRYAGRLVNIHPSLLPAFPGLDTHRRALEAGHAQAGASVHFVTAGLDAGPVIAQTAVPVLPGDDEAALAARVLVAEHELLPRALRWLVLDQLRIEGDRVVQTAGEPQGIVGAAAAGGPG